MKTVKNGVNLVAIAIRLKAGAYYSVLFLAILALIITAAAVTLSNQLFRGKDIDNGAKSDSRGNHFTTSTIPHQARSRPHQRPRTAKGSDSMKYLILFLAILALIVDAAASTDAATSYWWTLPDLVEAPLYTNGVPNITYRGIQPGYSLPVWNADNEELFYCCPVPLLWDNTTDITFRVNCSLDTANTDKNFTLALDWVFWTPDHDTVPSSNTTVSVETATGTASQYQGFQVDFTIEAGDIETGDVLGLRLRRLAASADEIAGEVVIHRTPLGFVRSDIADFLTDEELAAMLVADADVAAMAEDYAEGVDAVAMGIQLAVVVALCALAFWLNHYFLYILGGAAAMGWGIYYTSQGGTLYLTLGILVIVAGLYQLFRAGKYIGGW